MYYSKNFCKDRDGENETKMKGIRDLGAPTLAPRRQQLAPWPAGLG